MTQQQLWTKPADVKRRSNHGQRLLHQLMYSYEGPDGWINRNTLEEVVGTHNFTARISELRSAGHVIENRRVGDHSYYRWIEQVEGSTTNPRHCRTCRCGEETR